MSRGRGPRSRELDDDSLLRIFSKVGCARELAKLSLVSRRWRDLTCAVSHLDFKFEEASATTREELRTQEAVVSDVLCRASIRAPHSLKHLRVSFACTEEAAEVHGHWLLWATTMSFTKLELVAHGYSVEWGPGVWNATMRMKTLEELTIKGSFRTEKHLLLPRVLANGLQMTRLQKCVISNSNSILLETILATCPVLAELHVESDETLAGQALRVASNSLKIFSMVFDASDDVFEATVHAPSLTSFELQGPESVSIQFESAQSLRTLCVESPYKLYNLPDSLQDLKLVGACDLQRLPEMLMHTPMITDLRLKDVGVEGDGRIDIDHLLAPLVNLRNIYFYSDLLPHLRAGTRRFESLTVHLWPFCTSPNIGLLRALIKVHEIQRLVVHCMYITDSQAQAIIKGYEEWRFLYELSHFHPDRIKFVD